MMIKGTGPTLLGLKCAKMMPVSSWRDSVPSEGPHVHVKSTFRFSGLV